MTGTTPRDIEPADHAGLLALNAVHETELSPMTAEGFASAVEMAVYAQCFAESAGFLLAYDQTADLASANFRWFKARYEQFVYIDRVVISGSVRGRGLARALYADLAGRAEAAGHMRLACEVNIDPPNPASMSFHTGQGFFEVGRARQIGRAHV